MTKLSPQHQAWRRAESRKYAPGNTITCEKEREGFLAGAEAEHEAAKLVGRIEALAEAADTCDYWSGPWIEKVLRDAQARLDALIRGEEVKDGT